MRWQISRPEGTVSYTQVFILHIRAVRAIAVGLLVYTSWTGVSSSQQKKKKIQEMIIYPPPLVFPFLENVSTINWILQDLRWNRLLDEQWITNSLGSMKLWKPEHLLSALFHVDFHSAWPRSLQHASSYFHSTILMSYFMWVQEGLALISFFIHLPFE